MRLLLTGLFLLFFYTFVVGQSGVRSGTSEEWEYPKIDEDTLRILGPPSIISPVCLDPQDSIFRVEWEEYPNATHYTVVITPSDENFRKGRKSDSIITKDTFVDVESWYGNPFSIFTIYVFAIEYHGEEHVVFPFSDIFGCIQVNIPGSYRVLESECVKEELTQESILSGRAFVGDPTDDLLDYKFQLSIDPSFPDSLTYEASSFLFSYVKINDFGIDLEENTTYYWRASWDYSGDYYPYSKWSYPCSFTTGSWKSVERKESKELSYHISNGTVYLENINPEATLRLHDISGRVLSSHTGNTLDVSGISRGTYFIVIDGERVVKVQL
ncbi:MAG: hypothetical protein Kapaf2KO_18530 [Candidatus Kapaibacteriales bacterium]